MNIDVHISRQIRSRYIAELHKQTSKPKKSTPKKVSSKPRKKQTPVIDKELLLKMYKQGELDDILK